jgi:hypothetical protein
VAIYNIQINGYDNKTDKIRSETVWNKTKSVISEKGLPFVIETVSKVASAVAAGMVQGTMTGIK